MVTEMTFYTIFIFVVGIAILFKGWTKYAWITYFAITHFTPLIFFMQRYSDWLALNPNYTGI
jgi:hypothetical protein